MSLETILLLDNEAGIRKVVRALLQQLGYKVLEAGTDAEAVNIVLRPEFTIDLLLTDLGPESADHVKELRPDMKVLCLSPGPTELGDCRALEQHYPVIPKPFKPHSLARSIRQVLDEHVDSRGAVLNRPLQHRFGGLDPSHSYFRRHGITTQTANHFGAGFFPGPGVMTGRIVIPIHGEEGQLIAYAGHSVDKSEPKCKYWPAFNRSEVLFNFKPARCLIAECDLSVVVVDGLFECMKVHQAGFPSVVGLTGPSLSDVQEQLLTDSFYLIVLFLNGREMTDR